MVAALSGGSGAVAQLPVEARQDRAEERVLDEPERDLPAARAGTVDAPRDVRDRRDLFPLVILEKSRDPADEHLVELPEQRLVPVLPLVVDLHSLKQRLDVAVEIAVAGLQFGVEREGAGYDVELSIRAKQVVHTRHVGVFDLQIEVESGASGTLPKRAREPGISAPDEPPAQVEARAGAGRVISEVRDRTVELRKIHAVRRILRPIHESQLTRRDNGLVHSECPCRIRSRRLLLFHFRLRFGGRLSRADRSRRRVLRLNVVQFHARKREFREPRVAHQRRRFQRPAGSQDTALEGEGRVRQNGKGESIERDGVETKESVEARVGLGEKVGMPVENAPAGAEATLFGSGRGVLDGHADFLAEPYPGFHALFRLDAVPLDALSLPVLTHTSFVLKGGVLAASGELETSPAVRNVRLSDLSLSGLRLDYAQAKKAPAEPRAAAERPPVKGRAKGKRAPSSEPEWTMRLDKALISASEIGFVNHEKDPAYRVYLSQLEGSVSDLGNRASGARARFDARGRL